MFRSLLEIWIDVRLDGPSTATFDGPQSLLLDLQA